MPRSFSVTRQLAEKQGQAAETGSSDKSAAAAPSDDGSTELSRQSYDPNAELMLSPAPLTSAGALAPSAKASKAARVDLSARLSKDKAGSGKGTRPQLKELLRLAMFARHEVWPLSLSLCLLIVSSMVTMSVPWAVGRVTDLTGSGGKLSSQEVFRSLSPVVEITSLEMFIALMAGLLTVGACANFGRIAIMRIVSERVVARLRAGLYRRTVGQDAEFFDANRVGDLLSRLSSDTVIVGRSISQNISDGLRSLVGGIFAFSMMTLTSAKLTGLLLVVSPVVAACAFFYGRRIRSASRNLQKGVGTLSKIVEERLGNVKTIQMFVGESQEVRRYNNQVRKVFGIGRKIGFLDATFFASTSWMGNMTVLSILALGGNAVRNGTMSVGDLTTFMMYTVVAGSSLFGLSGFYTELMKGVGAATRLFELQDREPKIRSTPGLPVTSAQGDIEFRNVHFAYPTRPGVPIFSNLNFTIPAGANACIVGPSGGGKSTVPSLLLRFYQTTVGAIYINGVDIATMNAKSLRRRIGMVSQEPVLFSGTIAENIAYGRPNATRAEIVEAAVLANCRFISDFPDGLETQVGPRGAQLSGGQKQRIAIARALLKNPDILILDEATSALDAESETAITASVLPLMRGKTTTLSIAHRMSTIKRSDMVIVLSSEGTVAEVGSFAELSANKDSAFSRLMAWQLMGADVLSLDAARAGEGRPAPPPAPSLAEQMHRHEADEMARPTEEEIIEDDLEEDDQDDEDDEDVHNKHDDRVRRGGGRL